ncbi:unnamed protein product [Vicia faba]|uniref:Uncharacterized protein n=1 Tax=Vicia faba TaxID=3906 RepID=A0AAV1A7F3_VICFA|nr:unnamed protein product [Vicia faba]
MALVSDSLILRWITLDNALPRHPRLDIPAPDHKDFGIFPNLATIRTGNPSIQVSQKSSESSNASSASIPSSPSSISSQPLSQRKLLAESQTGKSGFQKLLEPQLPQLPGISPDRVVLGNVKVKLGRSRRRL